MISLAMFAAGLTFATRQFLDMYVPGVIDALPNTAQVWPALNIIMGNTGKMMFWNIALVCSTTSVEATNSSDVTYKVRSAILPYGTPSLPNPTLSNTMNFLGLSQLLRAWGYTMMFYLGLFAREGTIALALDWPQPMRFTTFFQCFGTTFYALNTIGTHKIAVSNAKPKAK